MRLFTNESTGRVWDQNVITHLFLSMLCRQLVFLINVLCAYVQVMQRNYEVLLGIRFTHHHLVEPREKKQKNI